MHEFDKEVILATLKKAQKEKIAADANKDATVYCIAHHLVTTDQVAEIEDKHSNQARLTVEVSYKGLDAHVVIWLDGDYNVIWMEE